MRWPISCIRRSSSRAGKRERLSDSLITPKYPWRSAPIAASRSASASTSSVSAPGAATLVIRPSSAASCAEMKPSSRISRVACFSPTYLGRKAVAPITIRSFDSGSAIA